MDPEDLERYSLGRTDPQDTARVEEHLLVCDRCRCKLEDTEGFAVAMKAAAAELDRGSARPRRILPALAAAAGLILTASLALRWGSDRQSAYSVDLAATRANMNITAPAGRPLELHPDLTGLPALSAYHIEIVDGTGKQVWRGDLAMPRTTVVAPGQSTGIYYVRVYTPAGGLLREYGLRIGT
jgi:hypothetical protein